MIELIFTKGPRVGERFAVEAECVTIGRLEECDIELNQPNVSRKHAIIKREGKSVSITDQRSGNGTFVNGKRITRATLRAGDMVRIGHHTMRVETRARRASKATKSQQVPMTVKEMLAEQPTRHESISRFFIEDYTSEPRRLEFAGDKLSLGRGEKCKLVLDDDQISRLHATITHRNGRFELKDVGSANGTYLNGARVIEAELSDENTIEVGRLVISARIIKGALHLTINKNSDRVAPTPVKKLRDSKSLPAASLAASSGVTPPISQPLNQPRPRYPIIAGLLTLAVTVGLLLVFVGRTYAAERQPPPHCCVK